MKRKQNPPAQSLRLDNHGLDRVLGPLEAQIMDLLWAKGESTIRDVWESLILRREIAFNTVMTVMNRLTQKGLLQRQGGQGSYRYRPAQAREVFIEQITQKVAGGLLKDFGATALIGFVNSLDEVDPAYVHQLEELLKKKANRDADTRTAHPGRENREE